MYQNKKPVRASLSPAIRVSVFSVFAAISVMMAIDAKPGDFRTTAPYLVILGHAVLALRYRSNPGLLIAAAYQTYFLGFLCTLLAVLLTITRFVEQPSLLTDMKQVGMAIGLALGTTVVALVAMNALSAIADAHEAISQPEDAGNLIPLFERVLEVMAGSEMPPAMLEMATSFRNVLNDLKESSQAAQILRGETASLSSLLERLCENVRTLTCSVESLVKASDDARGRSAAYAASLTQIQQVIEATVDLLQRKIVHELEQHPQSERRVA